MANNTVPIREIRKKVTKIHELISTSYHEAGHTIYSLLHLMHVFSVSIYEDKETKRIHGLTQYYYLGNLDEVPEGDVKKYMLLIEISNSYAGLIAEKILFKSISGSDKIPMFTKNLSSEDNIEANNLIKKYNIVPPGKKRSAYKRLLNKKVSLELNSNWDAVSTVAHALFKHRRLTYDDLKELLIKKTNNKKYWKEQFKKMDRYYAE